MTSTGAKILDGISNAKSCPIDDGMAVLGFSTVDDEAVSSHDFPLGTLCSTRFLALGRTSLWWMTPCWGDSSTSIPGETQFLLLELSDKTYAVMLPLIHENAFRATLRPFPSSDDHQQVALRIESGDVTVKASEWNSTLLVAAGTDPYELLQRAVTSAARFSGTAKHRSEKCVPSTMDYFGWCTWDAFYSKVSASGIQEGLKSFTDGGVCPKFLIIDDGWQQTDVDEPYRSSARGHVVTEDEIEVEEAANELFSGPGDHFPDPIHALPASKKGLSEENMNIFQAAWALLKHALAHIESFLFLAGKKVLDSTPSNSWRMKWFTALITGPLRPMLLRLYATSSDHTRRLMSVKANSKFSASTAGPEHELNSTASDLKAVIQSVKELHGVKYVYAWHAMGGFWGGIGANDPEMKKYSSTLIHPTPTPGILEVDPAVAWQQPVLSGVSIPTDPSELHRDMHAYLASAGIDGVKVDVQGTIGLVGSGAGGGAKLASTFHVSLEESVRLNFPGNHLINCMCHSTEDLYNMGDTNVARVSDDFYPKLDASHTTHIANCAYNSLFMSELVIPDWDMFHSKMDGKDRIPLLHAIARAVSGGPVYVSDRPGNQDFELLSRLVLPGGTVLRALLPGRPTEDCLFVDPTRDGKSALKVWSMNAVTGVLGIFNIQGSSWDRSHRGFRTHDVKPREVVAHVSPLKDVPLLPNADTYCVYSFADRRMKLLHGEEDMEMTLEGNGGSDSLVISPVVSDGTVQVAPIGLVEMLNGGGSILRLEMGKKCLSLTVRGSGDFLVYASHCPVKVSIHSEALDFSYLKSCLSFILPTKMDDSLLNVYIEF